MAKSWPTWRINPQSIPNSHKQKQLRNTQWVKYVYCPALLTLEVGRARRNQSTNTLWKKTFFQKRLQYCGSWRANIPEARANGFSQRTVVRLAFHFVYLTYIIHIPRALYITYIFFTIFYTIFSTSTSTSTPSSPSSSSPSSSPTSVSPTLSTPPTHFFLQPHLHDIHHLQRIHDLHHHHLYQYILYITYIFWST